MHLQVYKVALVEVNVVKDITNESVLQRNKRNLVLLFDVFPRNQPWIKSSILIQVYWNFLIEDLALLSLERIRLPSRIELLEVVHLLGVGGSHAGKIGKDYEMG